MGCVLQEIHDGVRGFDPFGLSGVICVQSGEDFVISNGVQVRCGVFYASGCGEIAMCLEDAGCMPVVIRHGKAAVCKACHATGVGVHAG